MTELTKTSELTLMLELSAHFQHCPVFVLQEQREVGHRQLRQMSPNEVSEPMATSSSSVKPRSSTSCFSLTAERLPRMYLSAMNISNFAKRLFKVRWRVVLCEEITECVFKIRLTFLCLCARDSRLHGMEPSTTMHFRDNCEQQFCYHGTIVYLILNFSLWISVVVCDKNMELLIGTVPVNLSKPVTLGQTFVMMVGMESSRF